MNQEQLMDRLSRLKRKLATTQAVWHSGRIDRLADALRAVERDLQVRQPANVPEGQSTSPDRLH